MEKERGKEGRKEECGLCGLVTTIDLQDHINLLGMPDKANSARGRGMEWSFPGMSAFETLTDMPI